MRIDRERLRAAGLTLVLLFVEVYGLAVHLGLQMRPTPLLDGYARLLMLDPAWGVAVAHVVPWALGGAAGVWLALAWAGRGASEKTGWVGAGREAALALVPLALLPLTLWFNHPPGRTLLAAGLLGVAAWRGWRLVAPGLEGARGVGRLAVFERRRTQAALAGALAGLGGLYLFALAWLRHASHWSSLIDLGLFYELYDNPVGLLHAPTLGHSFLGEHFSPVLVLLWPLMKLAPSPVTLLAVQAMALAGGGWLLFMWARERVGHAPLAMGLMVAYLLAPHVQQAALYDFHMDMLEAPMLFGLMWAIERGKARWAWVCAVLLWCTKEDTFIYTSVIGLYAALFRGQRRLGVGLIVVGVAQAAVVIGYVLPALRPPHDPAFFSTTGEVKQGYAFMGRYGHLGEEPEDVLWTALNPFYLSEHLTADGHMSSWLALLIVFGGLALLGGWPGALLAVPCFEILLGSGRLASFAFYYGAIVYPFAAMAAVEGARRLREAGAGGAPGLARVFGVTAGGATLALGVITGALLVWHPSSGVADHTEHKPWVITPHQARAEALMDAIPGGGRVAATGYLAVHLQPGRQVTMLPYGVDAAQYVLIDLQRPPWPLDHAGVRRLALGLVRGRGFRVEVLDPGGLALLVRDGGGAAGGVEALSAWLDQPVIEAELSEQTAYLGRAVYDETASNGAHLSITTGDTRGPGLALMGPYATLTPGGYVARYRLRWRDDVGDLPGERAAVTLDIVTHGDRLLRRQELSVAELRALGEGWLEREVAFEVAPGQRDLEFRVFYHDLGRLDVDVVRVTRAPAR